jgi:3-oxoacyl-[acyl-carrier-protein] synthase II
MRHEAWITGLGAVTSLGHQFDTFADRLLGGDSGIRQVDLLGDWDEPLGVAGIVQDVPAPDWMSPDSFHSLQRLDQFVISCALRSIRDSGLTLDDLSARRVGVVLGLGAEQLRAWENNFSNGSGSVDNPESEPRLALELLAQHLGTEGPSMTVAAACASGNCALGVALGWVSSGMVDLCIAGSADVVTPLAYVGFDNLRALSRSNRPPETASRPFDVDRDGFVMAEGGVAYVVESAAAARQRRATPYAELAGFGASSDASHIIIPNLDAEPASRAIRAALDDAGVNVDEVDYVNAHATSTPVGDRAECSALQLVFGSELAKLPVSSTKGATGHALSGAASVEALACLVALQRQSLPATKNLENPDPACSLLHVVGDARSCNVRVVISNSFGFGGSNTSIVLRQAA